ncbi:MAG: Xaa-Pro peptidase family protein, partial [Rhodothermales bacterium]
LLNAGSSMTYLTGLSFHLSERPVVGIFRKDGVPLLVLPELETEKTSNIGFDAQIHAYGEDTTTWQRAFQRASDEARLDFATIGLEPERFRVLELRYFEHAAPRAAFVDGAEALSVLRARKDADEVARIRRAVHIAEKALERVLSHVTPGITERELASRLTAYLLEGGSAPRLPFSPIVAFGSSTANPHAVPGDRPLAEGDLLLVDWGANAEGYFSDLTRMFSYGPVPDDLHRIVHIVREANSAARDAAAPGRTAGQVDRAARAVVENAGFGSRFIHRTGHGLGLDVHEPPYIRANNDVVLEEGMTFTIEPGIYIPQLGGARIEDDVVVTNNGAESISTISRKLVDVQSAPDYV